LGDGKQHAHRIRWEHAHKQVRPEQAEQRWTENHTRQHLGDDLRLSGAPASPPDHLAERQDYGDLEEEMDGQLEVAHEGIWRTQRERD
jgi:hypothetical protein